jgi:hypothetical protein
MLNYNHKEALQLVRKVLELVPEHTAPHLAILRIRSNELQYLLEEVDLKDEEEARLSKDAGDADPSEDQLHDMLVCATEMASSIKQLVTIDPSIRWSHSSDFLSAYNSLSMLEFAVGSKTVRVAIGAPTYVSADSTDPYTIELHASEKMEKED